MAFPDNVEALVAAEDVNAQDIANIAQYQEYINNGNFTAAADMIASGTINPKKLINAGRYNKVMGLVNDIQDFMVGHNTTYKNYIQNNINAYSDIALWTSGAEYYAPSGNVTGSVVSHKGRYFVCKLNHTSSSDNEPDIGANWQTYWNKLVDNQYVIQTDEPTGQIAGDIWFQIIE